MTTHSDNDHPLFIKRKHGVVIGEGTFGKVIVEQGSEKGVFFAVKHMKITPRDDDTTTIQREISALQYAKKHGVIGIVHMKDYHFDPANYKASVKLEMCAIDLHKLITAGRHHLLDDRICESIAMQMVHVMAHLHAHAYAHRDLKPQNIGVLSDGSLRLLDFGLARKVDPLALETGRFFTQEIVTLWWRCPWLLMSSMDYGMAKCMKETPGYKAEKRYLDVPNLSLRLDPFTVDMWSIGCILFEIFHNRHPFGRPLPPSNGISVLININQMLGTPEPSNLPYAIEYLPKRTSQLETVLSSEKSTPQWVQALIRSLFMWKPSDRLTAPQCAAMAMSYGVPLSIIPLKGCKSSGAKMDVTAGVQNVTRQMHRDKPNGSNDATIRQPKRKRADNLDVCPNGHALRKTLASKGMRCTICEKALYCKTHFRCDKCDFLKCVKCAAA